MIVPFLTINTHTYTHINREKRKSTWNHMILGLQRTFKILE